MAVDWHGQRLIVIDTHADSLTDVVHGRRRLTEGGAGGQVDGPRLVAVGHTLQFLSCWVEPEFKPERAAVQLFRYFEAFWEEVEDARGTLAVVTDLESLEAAVAGNRPGLVLSIEGSEGLSARPELLRLAFRLGVRLVSLTWNERNALADGAGEDPGGGGLSRAGRAMVAEMNRLGIIPDVSHLSRAGFWDLLDVTTRPAIASHSNCAGLTPHVRNLSDGQVRALARRGGIQGITFVRDFLGGDGSLTRVVDHILHHLAVVGDDRHIGLGSDFDGVSKPVSGLEDVTGLYRLADAMSARGIADATIRRILGDNYLDFLRTAWGHFALTCYLRGQRE
jgi:membrane dipeptidase